MAGSGGKGSTRPDASIVRSGWQNQGLLRILAYGRRRREAVLRSHDRRNLAALGNASDRPAAGLGEEAKALFLNSTTGREGLKYRFTAPDQLLSRSPRAGLGVRSFLRRTIGCVGLPTQFSSLIIVPTCRHSAQSRAFSAARRDESSTSG